MTQPKFITVNGRLVPYAEASVHLLSPTVKFGALVFEGLRAYWNESEDQLYVFRLREHFRRFHYTVRAMRFDAAYTDEGLTAMVVELLRANDVRDDAHLRVAAYVDGSGLYDATGPISTMCAAYGRRSAPLEEKQSSAGVVSWRRISDASFPPRLKVAANYHNARLGSLEAQANGYDEAIFLTDSGHVAEGSSACLLMVRDGALVSPAITEGILESVTRATLLEIAAEMGVPTVERTVDRTELYFAEEVFLCGTAAEVKPVTSIDRIPVGDGEIGRVTRQLWERYESLVRGKSPDRAEWRTAVYG